jgi:hypothetical protein
MRIHKYDYGIPKKGEELTYCGIKINKIVGGYSVTDRNDGVDCKRCLKQISKKRINGKS